MKILALLSLLISATSASAMPGMSGFFLKPAGVYWSTNTNDGDPYGVGATKNTKISTALHGTLAYLFSAGFFVGGTYVYLTEKTKTQVNLATTTDSSEIWTGFGPTLGWMSGGFFLAGTFLTAPTYSYTTTSTINYKGGSGYVADVGYLLWVSNGLGLGAQLSYYNATYTKLVSSGGTETTLSTQATDAFIRPSVALTFLF